MPHWWCTKQFNIHNVVITVSKLSIQRDPKYWSHITIQCELIGHSQSKAWQPTMTHTTWSPDTSRKNVCNTQLFPYKPYTIPSQNLECQSTFQHNHTTISPSAEYKEVKRYNNHNPAPKSYHCIHTSNVHLQKGIATKKQRRTHEKKANDMQFQSSWQKTMNTVPNPLNKLQNSDLPSKNSSAA